MIPTKVIHCKRSEKPVRGVCSLMRKVTCLRSPSPVETFYKQDVPCVHAKQDAVSYRTDIYMLFNQQRLDRMSLNQLSDWLDNQTPTSALNELRSKMSDEQLFQYVKSRYIQSPSELMAWAEYINVEFDGEAAKLQESQKTAKPDNEPDKPADSQPAPAPAAES